MKPQQYTARTVITVLPVLIAESFARFDEGTNVYQFHCIYNGTMVYLISSFLNFAACVLKLKIDHRPYADYSLDTHQLGLNN